MTENTSWTYCPVSGESQEEEIINHYTHLAGFILSIIGGIAILPYAYSYGTTIGISSCATYAASLILLYASSTYYHGCSCLIRKHKLKITDHICIYLLIAGTYTPFALGPLRDTHGWTMLYTEWSIAIIGILFKIFAINRFQLLSTIAYLAMGWLIVISGPILLETLSLSTLIWTAVGGFFYTFGVIFYLWDDLRFNHAIWHLFTLSGSFCHYFAVLGIVTEGFFL